MEQFDDQIHGAAALMLASSDEYEGQQEEDAVYEIFVAHLNNMANSEPERLKAFLIRLGLLED